MESKTQEQTEMEEYHVDKEDASQAQCLKNMPPPVVKGFLHLCTLSPLLWTTFSLNLASLATTQFTARDLPRNLYYIHWALVWVKIT